MIMNNVCVETSTINYGSAKKNNSLCLSKAILECISENEKLIFRKLETNIKKLISTEKHK